jgi:hypothetical protein
MKKTKNGRRMKKQAGVVRGTHLDETRLRRTVKKAVPQS